MKQGKRFGWIIWLLLAVVLVAVTVVMVRCMNREQPKQIDLRSFGEGEYPWKDSAAGGELPIGDENIDIRSFYVSEDGRQILLQNHHIRREEDAAGGVVSQVGNYLYRWENGHFQRLTTAENMENPILWTEERLYFYVWDNGFYLYAGDIGREGIETVRCVTLDAEEIYMDGVYAVCGDQVFFRAYENFGRREFVGTIRGDKICDIRRLQSIEENETVREAVFLGDAERILARVEAGIGEERIVLIDLSQSRERRTEVTLGELAGGLKGLRYLCAHGNQDVLYYMDESNTIHKMSLGEFLRKLEDKVENEGEKR